MANLGLPLETCYSKSRYVNCKYVLVLHHHNPPKGGTKYQNLVLLHILCCTSCEPHVLYWCKTELSFVLLMAAMQPHVEELFMHMHYTSSCSHVLCNYNTKTEQLQYQPTIYFVAVDLAGVQSCTNEHN